MTPAARKVFSVVYWALALGELPPTRREIAAACGWFSWGWVSELMQELIDGGYIVRDGVGRPRAIRLTELGRRTMPTVSIDLGTAHAIAETFTKRAK